ncbi:hypothetical protein D1007_02065 [Hordeum vulgare]|nr:hypothetical protein D1007_02065 [Hordeum vulgare]
MKMTIFGAHHGASCWNRGLDGTLFIITTATFGVVSPALLGGSTSARPRRTVRGGVFVSFAYDLLPRTPPLASSTSSAASPIRAGPRVASPLRTMASFAPAARPVDASELWTCEALAPPLLHIPSDVFALRRSPVPPRVAPCKAPVRSP